MSWAAIEPLPHDLLVVQTEAFQLNKMMDEADRQRDPSARAQDYLAVAKRSALFQKTVLESAELERLRCIALRASGARDQAVISCTQATRRPLHSLQPWSAWLELARTLAETSDDEETQLVLSGTTSQGKFSDGMSQDD